MQLVNYITYFYLFSKELYSQVVIVNEEIRSKPAATSASQTRWLFLHCACQEKWAISYTGNRWQVSPWLSAILHNHNSKFYCAVALRRCETLWNAREIASMALSAKQARHTENVFHCVVTSGKARFHSENEVWKFAGNLKLSLEVGTIRIKRNNPGSRVRPDMNIYIFYVLYIIRRELIRFI